MRAGVEENVIDDSRRREMKIGDVSRLSGIGIETLRFYEKSGLLDRPARTYSGYRLYSRDVLDRLVFIKRAQVLGFSLDEIKRLIDDARAGKSPCDEVREMVRQRLEDLDLRIQEMRRFRKELAATLEEWDRVGRAPGHVCGLIEHSKIERGIPFDGITRRSRRVAKFSPPRRRGR
ncbi:MAG TPA: heavy metal-responsive transcriptional regulator [Blastocatellia bacterium]|nr:heavy metal-responsive transcriptional regulator [Blastocatellia bacterium]